MGPQIIQAVVKTFGHLQWQQITRGTQICIQMDPQIVQVVMNKCGTYNGNSGGWGTQLSTHISIQIAQVVMGNVHLQWKYHHQGHRISTHIAQATRENTSTGELEFLLCPIRSHRL